MDVLVTTEWLSACLGEADLSIIDSSWHMPSINRSGREEFLAQHIPGAVFLDIDLLSDRSNPAPHMLPAARDFGKAMEKLGVDRTERIVVYDNSPLRTAARGWFMLRHFGAERVAILDGGLGKWIAEGRPTEGGEPKKAAARFDALPNQDEVVGKGEALEGRCAPFLDARGKGRFEGTEPDPRPGVARGHIPGARNLPYASLYRDDGTFRSRDEIRALFKEAGVEPEQPFVATCGSGVTANSLIFAAQLLGNDAARLYDGSWSEWGADPATPKAVGPA